MFLSFVVVGRENDTFRGTLNRTVAVECSGDLNVILPTSETKTFAR